MTSCGFFGHLFPTGATAGTPCYCGQYQRAESERGMRDTPPDATELHVRPDSTCNAATEGDSEQGHSGQSDASGEVPS